MLQNSNVMYESKPMFTIGITTYNRKDMLRQLVKSILEQDFDDFEIIIGNDYQAEFLTKEILNINDPRIIYINYEENQGELNNMNALLKAAKGRYFTWQFDDDLCAPGYLKESAFALKNYPNSLCLLTSYSFVYDQNSILPKKVKIVQPEILTGKECLRRYTTGKLRVSILAGFYETQYLRNLGGAKKLSNGHMALYAEYLLMVQIGQLPFVLYINSPLSLIRIHDGSFSSSAKQIEFNKQFELFKEAGIKLLREAIIIFSKPELVEDFKENLQSYLKSIICNVIVKSGGKFKKKDILNYKILLEKEFYFLKKTSLYLVAIEAINNSMKGIFVFIVKARLKSFIPAKHLKFARFIQSIIAKYRKMAF